MIKSDYRNIKEVPIRKELERSHEKRVHLTDIAKC